MLEICEAFNPILLSNSFEELLYAGCGNFAWAYQTNAVTDDMIPLIPEAILNSFGVYSNGSYTLSNPDPSTYAGCKGPFFQTEESPTTPQELYLVLSVNVTLNLSDGGTATVYVMGDSILNLNMTGKSKAFLRLFNNGTANIISGDDATVCIEQGGDSIVNHAASGNSVLDGETRGRAILNYTGSDATRGRVRGFTKSQINTGFNDTATLNIATYNKAINGVLV